jgi:hypothetical protein
MGAGRVYRSGLSRTRCFGHFDPISRAGIPAGVSVRLPPTPWQDEPGPMGRAIEPATAGFPAPTSSRIPSFGCHLGCSAIAEGLPVESSPGHHRGGGLGLKVLSASGVVSIRNRHGLAVSVKAGQGDRADEQRRRPPVPHLQG